MTDVAVQQRGVGAVFVVSAPSGAGKSTLVRRLLASLGELRFGLSHTTRPRRPGERDGVDYRFVDEARFVQLRDAGAFLEWAQVHGRLYGTTRSGVEEAIGRGEDVLLDLDVAGAASVRGQLPGAVLIFVLPPRFEELRRRLAERGTEEAEIQRRLETAGREIRRAEEFDYLVCNEQLDEAARLLEAIVLAERSRRPRQGELLRRVSATFPGGAAP